MKIKAFFMCESVRTIDGRLTLINPGIRELKFHRPLFPMDLQVPLFFAIQREPIDMEGPHKAICKLFIGDEQPTPAELEITFKEEGEVIAKTFGVGITAYGPVSCRVEFSVVGFSEIYDWPFRVVVGST